MQGQNSEERKADDIPKKQRRSLNDDEIDEEEEGGKSKMGRDHRFRSEMTSLDPKGRSLPLLFRTKLSKKLTVTHFYREWITKGRSDELKENAEKFIRISAQIPDLDATSPFMSEHRKSAHLIKETLALRDKYMDLEHSCYSGLKDVIDYKRHSLEPIIIYSANRIKPLPDLKQATCRMEDGIIFCWKDSRLLPFARSYDEFMSDYSKIVKYMHNKELLTFTHTRLELLERKFALHLTYNKERELTETKKAAHRDLFNVRKVDTHIHHSACMHPRELLLFVQKKAKTEPNLVVDRDKKTGKEITLKEMFETLNLNPDFLNVDMMDVQASDTFQRFDRFDKKYNPFGHQNLRSVFLKFDNLIKGRFLAEITKDVIKILESNKYEFVEWRISIHGKSKSEWNVLAKWIYDNHLISHNVRWMIQVPRLYSLLRQRNDIQNFQDLLDNFFDPLFEVTINPSKDINLYNLLLGLSGIDSVNDESMFEELKRVDLKPVEWTSKDNPPYYYWLYYFYANIYNLNVLRKERGLNTLQFRPHCGEAGDPSHLAAAYLVADGINHGIVLHKTPILQYLYYLKQIGLAMSPMSNNKLFLEYSKQPFHKFFMRGLNVSLSTDDPLIFHSTDEPLLEEYSIAAQIWNLTSVDLCELARNSVLQSGYEPIVKMHWIGDYRKKGKDGNEILKTNVPYARYLFRQETHEEEFHFLEKLTGGNFKPDFEIPPQTGCRIPDYYL